MPFSLSILIVRFGYPLRVGDKGLCLIPNVCLSIQDGEMGEGENSKNMRGVTRSITSLVTSGK